MKNLCYFLRENIVQNLVWQVLGQAYKHQQTTNNEIVHVDRQMHKGFIVNP